MTNNSITNISMGDLSLRNKYWKMSPTDSSNLSSTFTTNGMFLHTHYKRHVPLKIVIYNIKLIQQGPWARLILLSLSFSYAAIKYFLPIHWMCCDHYGFQFIQSKVAFGGYFHNHKCIQHWIVILYSQQPLIVNYNPNILHL